MSNSKAGSSATKNDTAKKTNRITAKDRFLASLGGLIVVILSLVPLGMLIVCCWSVGFSSWKLVFISLAFGSPFLVVAGFGVASIVRSNKNLVKMHAFLNSLSADERAEFDRMIVAHEDVEVVIDESQKRHFYSLDNDFKSKNHENTF